MSDSIPAITPPKNLPIFWVFCCAALLFTAGTAHADYVEGVLGAQNIVNAVNSLKTGTSTTYDGFFVKGYVPVASGTDLWRIDSCCCGAHIGLDAYSTETAAAKTWTHLCPSCSQPTSTGAQRFYSFGVDSALTTHDTNDIFGKLSYENGETKTAVSDLALTVGAAYLYAMFATYDTPVSSILGSSLSAASAASIRDLGDAIRFLMDDPAYSNYDASGNQFIKDMLNVNNADYWAMVYNPDNWYSEIGNYSVFVANMAYKSNGRLNENILWLSNAYSSYAGGSPTPEPATLAIFGLGMAGLGLAKARRRNSRR